MSTIVRTLVTLCVSCAAFAARADDACYSVPLSGLTFTSGALPTGNSPAGRDSARAEFMRPYAVVEGGEAYVTTSDAQPGRWWMYSWSADSASLAVRAPAGQEVKGSLYVPDAEWGRLVRVGFTLRPEQSTPDARTAFLRARLAHYDALLDSGAPGAAYFRWQADQTAKELGDTEETQRRAARPVDISDTYDLFTGGRAVSENLQLARDLPPQRPGQKPEPADALLPVSSIEGITVAPFDWTGKLAGAKPALDPLAGSIPADQHALFFPSFAALMTVLDETNDEGLPVIRGFSARSLDGHLAERYERQLCLPRTALSRLLGPSLVRSVAVTGSDPYFPTGTDVGVIFEPASTDALRQLLVTQVRAARTGPRAEAKTGEVEGVPYEGTVTPDRAVCAYVATVGERVVVTNSLEQLRALARVGAGKAPSISTLPEYAFFRARYPLAQEGESAFLFISDAAIRRWCGPEWRIGASRRLRAAAIMADVTAAHAKELGAGLASPQPVTPETPMRTLGEVTIGPAGVSSSVYGPALFLTPIRELKITEVPKDEADSYRRWRDTYQRNWSWAFDPIAASFGVGKDRLSADLSVIPLIIGSQYRTWIGATEGASIAPGAGDPHDAIAHAVVAINPESAAVKQASGMGRMMAPNIDVEPLGWLGQSIAVYADADPFWDQMLKSESPSRFFESEVYRLPVALQAEVGSALKLTAFLTAARSFIEQSAPGMTAWETRTHRDRPYVRVGLSPTAAEQGAGGAFDKVAVFYAATPGALVVTLNEDLLKRALDRQIDRGKDAAVRAPAWLGANLALRVRREGLALVQGPGRDAYRGAMQARAWANLAILNEWRRMFPDKDPAAMHEKLFGARPICPGGGAYSWNESFATMESSVYGHPGEPRPGPDSAGPLGAIEHADFGVTYQDGGLRARAVIDRAAK